MSDDQRPVLLFLCVANSARSQMAEGLARAFAPASIAVMSAGSKPSHVHPASIAALNNVGIDASTHSSKGLDDIPQDRVRWVITLCAEEVCPIFPGDVLKLHWPMPDPAAISGTDQLSAFESVRDQIQAKLTELFAAWPPS